MVISHGYVSLPEGNLIPGALFWDVKISLDLCKSGCHIATTRRTPQVRRKSWAALWGPTAVTSRAKFRAFPGCARKGWETWLFIRLFATGCHIFNQITRGIFKLHPTKSHQPGSNEEKTASCAPFDRLHSELRVQSIWQVMATLNDF
jgi:hypothetical protein